MLFILTTLAHCLVWVLRHTGRGSGTTLPGFIVERLCPRILNKYAKLYAKIICVSGTNGKTTTQLLISTVYKAAGYTVVSNASGSNMFRGIATTLVLAGRQTKKNSILVLEVEEATFPQFCVYMQPHYCILTNLFRDQLDAYGELYTTQRYLSTGLQKSPKTQVIYNADDPMICAITQGAPNRSYAYSLGKYKNNISYEKGGTTLVIKPYIKLETMEDNADSLHFTYTVNHTIQRQTITIPGVYNISNTLAVLATVIIDGLNRDFYVNALSTVLPPFGRGEKISLVPNTRQSTILLAKNPTGFAQVINLIQPSSIVLCVLNDNIPDGRDISWIWDIVFPAKVSSFYMICAGSRAYDMAIRLQYENVKNISVEPQIRSSIELFKKSIQHGQYSYICANYSAMNEVRKSLNLPAYATH